VTRRDIAAADVLAKLGSKGVSADHNVSLSRPPKSAHEPLLVYQGLVNVMIAELDLVAVLDHAQSLPVPFSLSELTPDNKKTLPPHAVLLNPAFIELCARQGSHFFLGSDGLVHKNSYFQPMRTPNTESKLSLTGTIDQRFYLKPPWYELFRTLLSEGQSVLLIGPAGAGKSEAVKHVFQERKQKLLVVPCNPRLNANDLEGVTDLVVDGEHQVTRFTPAAPAIASEHGYGLLLDEADALAPAAAFSLYRLMDREPMHITRRGHDALVPLHDDFALVGTQNTEGRGDDKGLYHARAYQDEAFLDRWDAVIRADYPTKDQEVLILRKRTGISGSKAQKVVDAAGALRNMLAQDEIVFTMSIRRSVKVALNLARGRTPEQAWSLAVLNRATSEDRGNIVETVMSRIYGDTWKKT